MEMRNGQVKVYVWRTGSSKEATLSEETGHAALQVRTMSGDTNYLSWYPSGSLWTTSRARMPPGYGKRHSDLVGDPQNGGRRAFSDKVLNLAVPRPGTEYDDVQTRSADCKAVFSYESKKAEVVTKAVYAFIEDLKNGNQTTSAFAGPMEYRILTQNCSSTVAHALRRGVEAAFPDGTGLEWPNHSIWTPYRVWNYTVALVTHMTDSGLNAIITRQG